MSQAELKVVLCVDLRYLSAQSALYAIDLQLITCTLNKHIQCISELRS